MISKSRAVVRVLAVLIGLLSGGLCPAQEPSDPVIAELDARVTQFLEGVSLGDTPAAYQELLRGSQLSTETEAIEELVQKTSQLPERYGSYRAFEQISAKRVGADLVFLRYLYKCENFPVVWYFTFYPTPQSSIAVETNNNWRVIVVRFDTDLELLSLLAD